MGTDTKIEWTDHTFNPWIGCTKISPACDHCYAESMARRRKWVSWGPGEPRRRTAATTWAAVRQWDRKAKAAGRVDSVFVASLADWADAEVPDDWRTDLAAAMAETTNLEYLMLTKRHALAQRHLEANFTRLQDRIRVGFTVENATMAAARLPYLDKLAVSGWRTFVSYEPALSLVDWRPWLERRAIGWLIAGGESGPGARPPHPDWFRLARDLCVEFGVPFFFKQWGEWVPLIDREKEDPDWRQDYRVADTRPHQFKILNLAGGRGFHGERVHLMKHTSKAAAGAKLDGREWREFPT